MATWRNTTREALVNEVKTKLEAVDAIKTVVRRLPTYEGLSEFNESQFPVASITAGLPVPTEKKSARIPGDVDRIMSDLTIRVNCYFQDNEDADATLSELLEKLWIALYADPRFEENAIEAVLKPIADVEYWHPYCAFGIDIVVTYIHSTGGI